jgi:ribonucleoside-diphosphate reductase alpha chain
MSERERLPARRCAELVDFVHDGRRWTVTVGRFADGRVGELFVDGPKDAPIVALAQESAIIASIALQNGAHLETLRHALAGRDAGPLAAALQIVGGAGP